MLSQDGKATQAVRDGTFPQTTTQVKSFSRACNIYRRFIKIYKEKSGALSHVLRNDEDRDLENPTDKQQLAFDRLKYKLALLAIISLQNAYYAWR